MSILARRPPYGFGHSDRPAFLLPLGQLASEKKDEHRAPLLEAIRHGSVGTWAHFYLHGEFDFSDERMVDSMGLALPKNPA